MRPMAALSILLVAGGFASTPALACKGHYLLYRDDFHKVNPTWDRQDWFTIGAGRAAMTPDVGKALTVLLNGATFDQADICADIVMARPADPSKPFGGLVFWVDSYANLYGLFISTAGTVAIGRAQDRKWSLVVPWRKLDGLQSRPGSINTMRVIVAGNTANTYVNDRSVANFTGQPPRDGGMIGFHGESEIDHADTWAFTNLKITDAP